MVHQEFLEQPLDEVLELIWVMREEGDMSLSSLLERSPEENTDQIIERLKTEHLIEVHGDGIRLMPAGEERAKAVVRRQRLAERLFSDVLDVPLSESEQQACLMEHILSPAVTEKVCAFLGHPPTCPHGHPIPPGKCCVEKRETSVQPVVTPLSSLPPGEEGRIAFIAPSASKRLDRLVSFGVVPGTVLLLRQKHPSYVIEVGGTTLALEEDLAREIYVRRES
jgi:DtxR family Mn-dependent transcriptional regulator